VSSASRGAPSPGGDDCARLLHPHQPIWSLLIIALDIGIIWALATYRREAV
jgi:hypothetical protein